MAYPKYKKEVKRQQKAYDQMVKACAYDPNAVICGDRPKMLSFLDVIKLILKG